MAMDNDSVENISASVVREYLSRKGLKATLQVLDDELPRDDNSISNRQLLAKELSITSLLAANKEQDEPLRSMLEVIIRYVATHKKSHDTSPKKLPHDKTKDNQQNISEPSVRSKFNSTGLKSSSNSQYGINSRDKFSGDSEYNGTSNNEFCIGNNEYESSQTQSYAKYQPRPSTADLYSRVKTDSMVLEDSEESETLVGSGKAGLFSSKSEQFGGHKDVLRQKQRVCGMTMSLQSTAEKDSRRKQFKPRGMPNDVHASNDANLPTNNSNKTSDIRSSAQIKDILNDKPTRPTRDLSELKKIFAAEAKLANDLNNQNSVEKPSDVNRVTNGSDIRESCESRTESLSSASSARSKESPRVEKIGDLELCDLDDLDLGGDTSVAPSHIRSIPQRSLQWPCKPIDLNTAIKLKTVIFGSAVASFNEEWITQPLCFCELPDLTYGIVQHKGGPCGVLASVQAYVLYEMLFGSQAVAFSSLNAMESSTRSECLALALCRVLWKCGELERAVVALPGRREHFLGGKMFKTDGVTETLLLYSFTVYENLVAFMKENVLQLENGSCGVVLCLYSAILSRSIQQVQSDMDDPGGQLMGAHFYCTQEIVNLLLTGRAVSNIFNGVMELASDDGSQEIVNLLLAGRAVSNIFNGVMELASDDGSQVMRLTGVSERGDVGLLSLFEHYKSCEVGTYYKTPKVPIWVICSESHFSVLFSHKRELMSDWKAERLFDLFYYDGLSKQDHEIKLTIDTVTRGYEPPSDPDLCPPLELCLRTKWHDAHISWNGSEPIL